MIELYKHNQEAYDNVINHLKISNRTCIIHPTGTGKSFIALKWLYENKDKKCLFLTSTDVIIDQLIKYMAKCGLRLSDFPNLEVGTYQGLKNNSNKYDCIVLDEFHRCGAKEWGKEVNKILDNNKDSKVLGTSATPIRYLDEQRDMSEEIFNGDIASKMSLAEAIALGILPVPMYINCLYSFEEDINKVQDKIDKCRNKEEKLKLQIRLDEAKKMLENAYGLDKIFEKYITNKNGKFVVFCKDRQHMNKMKEEALKWFSKINKNVNIGEVCYDIPDQINKYTIDRFNNVKNDDINLLFSIDMLNEGLHVEDIDGLIMLRPTNSLILFLQQLGRGLGSCKGTPLIFDIVNNSDNFDTIYDFKLELVSVIEKHKKNITDEAELERLDSIIKQFEIIDEYKSFIDILDNISLDATFTWDSWYNLACDYYLKNGDLNIPRRYKTTEGYALGNWIEMQKVNQNKLTSDRKNMLDNIGMIWGNVNDENFNKWYDLAKKYYKHYGNLNVDSNFKTKDGINYDKDGFELGDKISRYRSYKNRLPKKIIKLLDEIGMIWDLRKFNQDEYYNLAKKYYEHNKHLDIHGNFKTKDGINYDLEGIKLGGWIHRLRDDYAEGRLSKEEIDRMNSIKMIWDKQDKIWNDYYKLAKKYFDEYGHLNIKARYKTSDDINLGIWIQRQKTDYVNKRLSKERLKKLEEIGIIWNVKEDDLVKSKIDLKTKDKVTDYLGGKLDQLLTEYNNTKFESSNDTEKLNKDFNDLIYSAKTKEKYLSEGFTDYISKPFSKDQIK